MKKSKIKPIVQTKLEKQTQEAHARSFEEIVIDIEKQTIKIEVLVKDREILYEIFLKKKEKLIEERLNLRQILKIKKETCASNLDKRALPYRGAHTVRFLGPPQGEPHS